jgi:hypothetical protein
MMFGLGLGGLGVKLAMLAALAVVVGLGIWYVTSLKSERDMAIARSGALETANTVQQSTIEHQVEAISEWAESQARVQRNLDRLSEAQEEANSEARRLNDVLSKHNLTELSKAKPGLIERRINRGTTNVFRMFESETSRSSDQHSGDTSSESGPSSP